MSNTSNAVMTILDPGAEGWPQAPKITNAERQLFGDLAESVRLMGSTAAMAQDAYALTCKAQTELIVADEVIAEAVERLYRLQESITDEYRQLAAKAIERHAAFFTAEYCAKQEAKIGVPRDSDDQSAPRAYTGGRGTYKNSDEEVPVGT